jgi:uncharacterized protein YwqG
MAASQLLQLAFHGRAANKRDKAPLSFVMQWDCAELARQDATDLLPSVGALYFFCDLAWGDPFDFQFVYAEGPSDDWQEVQVPADLPPVNGEEGVHLVPYCSPRVECACRHELASDYLRGEPTGSQSQGSQGSSVQVRSIQAPPPNHMFGPPSFVQGHVEEHLDEYVLLLELSSRKVIGHEFGEGVYQFMIRPVHLRERRFDRVKLVASAY